MLRILILITALFEASFLLGPNYGQWENDYTQQFLWQSSASTVTNLQLDLTSITPKIDPRKVPGLPPSMYLSSYNCLGQLGPIGPQGPLGTLGPIGSNVWNPTDYFKIVASWAPDLFTKDQSKTGGLGKEGPLGKNGAVSPEQYFGLSNPGKNLFENNDFAVHLRGFGLWSVLGPIGPLGPLGLLGPLGPLGPHGFLPNDDGEQIDNGKVIRKISVEFNEQKKVEYELFEWQNDDFAMKMKDNDCSFMVSGDLGLREEKSFNFKSHSNEIVTIVLVPEQQMDVFELFLYDSRGKKIAESVASTFINWIMVKVPKDSFLRVMVKLGASYHFLTSKFRLLVVGSTENLNKNNVAGNHVKAWYEINE